MRARVGERIRGLRLERGLRLADVAAMSGLSEPHLSRIERGQRWPSVQVLLGLSNTFGVEPSVLLGGFTPPSFTVTHHADANWRGRETDGSGVMSWNSNHIHYDHASRVSVDQVDSDRKAGGGSPEDLLGMAFAGSFSMALARQLEAAGFEPRMVQTDAEVQSAASAAGHAIAEIRLSCAADVDKIDQHTFHEIAQLTRQMCVIGRALLGVNITLETTLIEAGTESSAHTANGPAAKSKSASRPRKRSTSASLGAR